MNLKFFVYQIAVVFACGFSLVMAEETDQLISNSDFESTSRESKQPVAWKAERGTPTLMADGGRSGANYIRMVDESDSDTHMLESRHIEVRPNGQYKASVWIRTGDEGGPGIYLSFHNASGVRLSNQYAKAKGPLKTWTKVEIGGIAPKYSASVRVSLYSFLKDVGTYDFDDVALQVTGGDDPSSTSRLKSSVTEVVEIGLRRELLVDRHLVDDIKGLRFELHYPRDEGSVLALNKPWEGPFSAYTTVLRVGEKYRVYYRGRPAVGADGDETETTCVAESEDGITWTRPNLGIHEVNGTTENNVVLAKMSPYSHNFSPFIDINPNVDAKEKFKGVGGLHPGGLALFVSEDGYRWKLKKKQILTSKEFAFDSQACTFWSESEKKYLCYFRTWKNKTRWVSRATSDDCLTWSSPVEMKTDRPLEHFYTTQTHPYFRAPHIYVSLPVRFIPKRQVVTEEQAKTIGVNPKYFKDTSDAVFATSRGGDKFDRTFMSSFLRPGIGLENWVSRTNYPALNLAQTGPTEMSIYVNQNYAQATAHLRRYSLRLDGFASLRADYEGGEMLTRPLIFTGKKLRMNFSTSAAGGIRVELQSVDGKPIPGFRLFDCREQIGNEIEREVTWDSEGDLAALSGKPVRLRFVMKDADLFAFRFTEK